MIRGEEFLGYETEELTVAVQYRKTRKEAEFLIFVANKADVPFYLDVSRFYAEYRGKKDRSWSKADLITWGDDTRSTGTPFWNTLILLPLFLLSGLWGESDEAEVPTVKFFTNPIYSTDIAPGSDDSGMAYAPVRRIEEIRLVLPIKDESFVFAF